jgi:hypothetical protein
MCTDNKTAAKTYCWWHNWCKQLLLLLCCVAQHDGNAVQPLVTTGFYLFGLGLPRLNMR